MPQQDKKPNLKRYYSIGEVAELFDLKASVIRFWEGEFDYLRPHKNAKGDRRFTKENLEQVRLIHHLLKERGFTIEGARKEIASRKDELTEKLRLIERLKAVREELNRLRDTF